MTEITPAARQMAADLCTDTTAFDALVRLCARFIAMQNDMVEIGRLCALCVAEWTVRGDIAAIAAKYKVETDPLVDVIAALGDGRAGGNPKSYAACLRAELAMRGMVLVKCK